MFGISLFLMFLYCLYFIKHPYFELKKVNIKRSKVMLYTEVGFGIFWFILLNTLYYQWVVARSPVLACRIVAKKRGYYSRFSIG